MAAAVAVLRAHRLLRDASRTMRIVASREGWPRPLSPVRFLVLAEIGETGLLAPRPVHLATLLRVSPSSLAYHLDLLEEDGLIARARPFSQDGRRTVVRLTDAGLYVLWRTARALGSTLDPPPGTLDPPP